jgi:hypothetical protein
VTRTYTSRRQTIVQAITDTLKCIDGTGEFLTNLNNNVHPRLLFWDEITEFPAVHCNAGREIRQYQGGGYKDRYLDVTIRCYVQEENAALALDSLLEDVETVLEETPTLDYLDKRGAPQRMHKITILSIDTDEGVLEPLGVGELFIQVRY